MSDGLDSAEITGKECWVTGRHGICKGLKTDGHAIWIAVDHSDGAQMLHGVEEVSFTPPEPPAVDAEVERLAKGARRILEKGSLLSWEGLTGYRRIKWREAVNYIRAECTKAPRVCPFVEPSEAKAVISDEELGEELRKAYHGVPVGRGWTLEKGYLAEARCAKRLLL